jgi:tetratricopeptide (TPR) repeat protein
VVRGTLCFPCKAAFHDLQRVVTKTNDRSKSQLAIEYGYRLRDASPQTWVFWVCAKDLNAIQTDFRKIAKALHLPECDEKDTDIFNLVRGWLQHESNGPWIMIVDNVDDIAVLTARAPNTSPADGSGSSPVPEVREFISPSQNGSVLITSRNREAAQMITGNCAYHIDVGDMEEAEALALLRSKLHSKVQCTDREATELIKSIDFMPLAISQIAANISINYPRLTIQKAIQQLNNPSDETTELLESSAHETTRDIHRTNSIVKTWHLSFQYVHDTQPSAARLLSLMCLFDRQCIPEALLTSQYGGEAAASVILLEPRLMWWKRARWRRLRLGKRVRVTAQSPTRKSEQFRHTFDDDWRVLTDFAFVRTNIDGQHFNMHRLVQHATRRWLEINGKLADWQYRYVSILESYFPQPEHDNWKVCNYLFPHAQQAVAYRPLDRAALRGWALLIQAVSRFAYIIGNFTAAEGFGRIALSTLEHVLGRQDEDSLRSSQHMGVVLSAERRYDQAEIFLRQAFEGREILLGRHHLDTGDSAHMLGSVLNKQKKYAEGEAMQMRAIEAREQIYGPKHIETQTLMSGLAFSCVQNGRLEQAELLHRRVHGLQKDASGKDTYDKCQSRRALAVLLSMQGKTAESENIHREVVEIQAKQDGLHHFETITSINFLGEALMKQGKVEAAIRRFRTVVGGYNDCDEKAREKLLNVMNNLAQALLQQGSLEEAHHLSQKMVVESERLLGVEHVDTLVSVHTLADVLMRQEQYERAVVMYERAYVGTAKCCGADHPDTKDFFNDLSQAENRLLMWSCEPQDIFKNRSQGTCSQLHASETLQSRSMVAQCI